MAATVTTADLDGMLATALAPPATPADLQARVMAAIAREGMADREPVRLRLLEEHGRAVAMLRRGVVWRCAEAAALAGCITLPVRAGVHALSFGLAGAFGVPSPAWTGLLPLAVAGGAAALALRRRPEGRRLSYG